MDLRFQKLLEVSKEILEELNYTVLIEKIVTRAVEFFRADAGAIGILDPDGHIFYPYLYNLPENIKRIRMKNAGGVAGYVVRTNQPLVLDNYPEHPDSVPAYVEAGVKTLLAVPLKHRGEPFGALGIFGKSPEKNFSRDALEYLEIFAAFASTAIMNARQYAELKRTKEALEETEELYRIVVDTSGDAMLLIDSHGKVVFANHAFWKFINTEKEILNVEAIINEAHRNRWNQAFKKVLSEGKSAGMEEIRITAQTGEVREMAVSIEPVSYQGKKHVVAVMRDLTEIGELYRELLQSSKLGTLGEVAAGLAHEINNPLHIIRTSAELLLRDKYPNVESIREKMGIILDNVGRISNLLRQFLHLSRPRNRAEPTIFDVCAETEEIIQSLQKIYATDGVLITCKYPETPVNTYALRDEYRQLLYNLLSNAHNAIVETGVGNEINIKVNVNGSFAQLCVTDNGPGIPEKDVRRIFEPFYTTRPGGTGLGLAIVKRIADKNRWEIQVESGKAKGTTFRIFIPIHNVAEKSRE